MNLKKYLRQQAENDKKNMLSEEDEQYCRQIASQTPSAALKRTHYPAVALVSSAVAVCITLSITLPIFLKKPPVDDILYKEENIKSEICLLEDVNFNSKYFQLTDIDAQTFINFDGVSKDNLYFTVNTSTVIYKLNMYLVVNDKYNFNFELAEELSVKDLSFYTVKYSILKIETFDGSIVEYRGYVQNSSETVYIEYTQLIDLGEHAFFNDIQSILKIK